MDIRKLLVIPQLIWYGMRAPRDQRQVWDRFWSGIQRTGAGGEVLWDAASQAELDAVLARVLARMDRSLPVVDVGCGNGRFSRLLAAHFPRVVGIDISSHAVQKARAESRGIANVEYRVVDVSAPGAGRALGDELGEVNVFMRGVFHTFNAAQRTSTVANLAHMLGRRGVLYGLETNYEGDPLDQLVAQGATMTRLPEPVRKCIAAGVRPPSHFGEAEAREFFPSHGWEMLESGPLTIHGIPLTTAGELEPIPGFYAIVRQRGADAVDEPAPGVVADDLEGYRARAFFASRIPAQDALQAFVPTDQAPAPEVQAVARRSGASRWQPVDRGHRVLVLYDGGPYSREHFQLADGAWDHEHCSRCRDRIDSMTLCWVTHDDPHVLLDEKCYRLAFGDAAADADL